MDDGMIGELIFDNCRTPLNSTWGKEGEGFYLSLWDGVGRALRFLPDSDLHWHSRQ